MNPIDDQLNRLFRAAHQVSPPQVPPPAFGLETRVLAAWREAGRSPSAFWDMTVLTRGLILAGVILAACALPALTSGSAESGPFADVVQLTDSTLPSDASP
jgi:hypothetical protein